MFTWWKKRDRTKIPAATAAAVIMSAAALAFSIGVARWSWLILDEQIRLREDFTELKNDFAQMEIEFGVWGRKFDKAWEELKRVRSFGR
jgi:hypothetical protein